MLSDRHSELEDQLNTCAQASRAAIGEARRHHQQLLHIISQFQHDCSHSQRPAHPRNCERVRAVAEDFEQHQVQLRATMRTLIQEFSDDLTKAWNDMEQHAHLVTIMLFGRTRAGKSTTMEALIGGSGKTIGTGCQHTTRTVKAYYFPHNHNTDLQPALRIVDTPGIEGFNGDRLADMARDYIERADHVLFILTDDKASAGELNEFGRIQTHGKGVTVLLNVKTSDDDLDLLTGAPQHVFKAREIEGHRQRICSYLKKHHSLNISHVLPLHARAAWIARSSAELPDGVDDRAQLLVNSGFESLAQRISSFIANEALPARQRAPRERLRMRIDLIRNKILPFQEYFKQLLQHLNTLAADLQSGMNQALKQVQRDLSSINARFDAASTQISGLVDDVLAVRGSSSTIENRWNSLLKRHEITDIPDWFCNRTIRTFTRTLEQKVQASPLYHGFAAAGSTGHLFSAYYDLQSNEGCRKVGKAGLRAGSGIAATLLTGWAIVNFWNPSGWAAAAAATATGAAGIVGESIARDATDDWEASARRKLYQQRSSIIQSLEQRLRADQRALQDRCHRWATDLMRSQTDVMQAAIRSVQTAAVTMKNGADKCLRELDQVAGRLE